jgi:lipoprotein-releasing system permease protein
MFKPIPLFIGWRFAQARRQSIMASFISLASTMGIAIGVFVLIVGLSAMNGFEMELNHRVLGIIPSAQIDSSTGPFSQVEKAVGILKEHKDIKAAAPLISIEGLVSKGNVFKGVLIRGVDPKEEKTVLKIEEFLTTGGLDVLADRSVPNIILGDKIAKKLNVKIGDTVELIIAKVDSSGAMQAPTGKIFTIRGIMKIGGELDNMFALVNINQARELLGLNSTEATGISVRVADNYSAREQGYDATRYLLNKFNGSFYVHSWMSSQGNLYRDIQMIRSIMYLALVMVVAVACFNIVSNLIMAVNEKRSEIAILLSMGYSRISVMLTFIVQGAISGCLGTICGAVIGIITALNLTVILKTIENIFSFQILNSDVYFIDFVPSEVHTMDVLLVVGVAVSLSLLASLIPSWVSSRVHPAQELSGK